MRNTFLALLVATSPCAAWADGQSPVQADLSLIEGVTYCNATGFAAMDNILEIGKTTERLAHWTTSASGDLIEVYADLNATNAAGNPAVYSVIVVKDADSGAAFKLAHANQDWSEIGTDIADFDGSYSFIRNFRCEKPEGFCKDTDDLFSAEELAAAGVIDRGTIQVSSNFALTFRELANGEGVLIAANDIRTCYVTMAAFE